MSRQIVTSDFAAAEARIAHPASVGTPQETLTADGYAARIIKLIPSEVVAVYLFLAGIITAGRPRVEDRGPLLAVVFVFLLIGTWAYLARVVGVSSRLQLAVSTVAFAVWVFSLGGPFPYLMSAVGMVYDPLHGAILLPLYTFLVPMMDNRFTPSTPAPLTLTR
jgi:hypothetical protein